MAESARSVPDAFDALADVHRRHILTLLGREPHSVQELADELPISRPAVSRHLRILADAGLVNEQRVGTRHIFRLDESGLDAVQAYLGRVWGEAMTRFTLFAENTLPREREAGAPTAEADR